MVWRMSMVILDLKKIIDLAYLGSAYCFSVQLVSHLMLMVCVGPPEGSALHIANHAFCYADSF